MYRCGQCGKEVNLGATDPVRCPYCGFKIIFKTRPGVVKKVKPK
jgi:DNA-directed RNA polymerase subunit P